MKTKILKALQNGAEHYVSGEQLSEMLGVSRTMIWKVINQLKADGYLIESSSRKGYRLVPGQDKLSQSALNLMANEIAFINRVDFHETIDSTNLEAKRLALDPEQNQILVVSDEQQMGRGRLGRNWFSEKGTGLWSSLLLRPDIEPEASFKMTLIAAVSVAKAVRSLTGLEAKIKWPNDIVVNRKKICGILTEMSAEWQRINYLVVGVGVNVNQTNFPEEIAEIASSLAIESGKAQSRLELLNAYLKELAYYQNALFDPIVAAELLTHYRELSATLGQRVRVIGKEEKLGNAIALSDEGALLVAFDDGTESYVNYGEVSVRGIDFYA